MKLSARGLARQLVVAQRDFVPLWKETSISEHDGNIASPHSGVCAQGINDNNCDLIPCSANKGRTACRVRAVCVATLTIAEVHAGQNMSDMAEE